jgi:hypothetical protein
VKLLGVLAFLVILPAQGVRAQTWSLIGFSAAPLDAPRVVSAVDKFMASEVGKAFPGKLLLQVNVANGANPATHSIVPIYKDFAERETFVQSIQGTQAWNEMMGVFGEVTEPVSTVLYQVVKSWGDINDDDHVWIAHAFDVSDPEAFLAAVDAFITSPTGKKFPGQVYLSQVVAGGISPVSHVISVGYASEQEMAAWTAIRNASADWATYVDASEPTSEYLGASLARDVKSWGPATLQQLAGP